ncbi:Uncharacterised protein [BD1-7 clade bacterium]|uniref:Phytanoyl-CoA dioxygenase (PhyH) n=1 Tax=BD1-7 clade bacterium TaxID=2029982 RepID=A0A5S9MP02_9GAMM|nr:Uncharacterised protein [BD1-7 clade bacterium]
MFDVDFHQRLIMNQVLLAQAACLLTDSDSLCLCIENDAEARGYTYQMRDDQLFVLPKRTSANLIVHLSTTQFQQLISEEFSFLGLVETGQITFERGSKDQLGNWPAVLQVLYYQREVWSPAVSQSLKRLDLHHKFRLTDPVDDVVRFLHRTGYVVFRQVFSFAEYRVLSDNLDQHIQALEDDDPHGRWYENAAGDSKLGKIAYLEEIDDHFRQLADDPRLKQIARYAGPELAMAHECMDGVQCIINRSHMADNRSLHWHKLCDLGGHPLLCPGLVVTLHLDEGTVETGRTAFMAGSHKYANTPADPELGESSVVAIDTQPGDITVHYAHTLHQIQAPTRNHVKRKVIGVQYHKLKLFTATAKDAVAPDTRKSFVFVHRAIGHP